MNNVSVAFLCVVFWFEELISLLTILIYLILFSVGWVQDAVVRGCTGGWEQDYELAVLNKHLLQEKWLWTRSIFEVLCLWYEETFLSAESSTVKLLPKGCIFYGMFCLIAHVRRSILLGKEMETSWLAKHNTEQNRKHHINLGKSEKKIHIRDCW